MAVLMIAGAVQAVEITKGMSADIHGTLLKPFDVDTGTGTSNDIDYLNIESKHGTWLMDVEGGVRYMNTRAFLGYETTTRKKTGRRLLARLQYTKHTLYGHGPVRTRYVAAGVSFKY